MTLLGAIQTTDRRLTAYGCTVLAERSIDGHDLEVRARLGEDEVLTSKLAVRWLCHQALWVADGLDSGFDRSYYVADPDPMGNVPAQLRAWAQDDAEQQFARAQLAENGRLRLVFRGAAGQYLLSAQSLAPPEPPVPSAGTDLRRPRHRRAGRLGRARRAFVGHGP